MTNLIGACAPELPQPSAVAPSWRDAPRPLSNFASTTETSPQRGEIAWSQLASEFRSYAEQDAPRNCPSPDDHNACNAWKKTQLPLWSPAAFQGTRAKENVAGVSWIVFDLDQEPTLTEENIREALDGTAAILMGSTRWTPTSMMGRLVIATSRIVSAAEYEILWDVVACELAANGVPVGCESKDPSRAWYLPHRPHGGASPYFVEFSGTPIDIDAKLALAADETDPEEDDGRKLDPSNWRPPAPESRIRAVLALANAWPPTPHRHEAQFALAGALLRSGWPDNEAIQLLCDVCRTSKTASEEPEKRAETVRRTREELLAGRPVTGWSRLESMIGATVKEVRALLQPASWTGFIASLTRTSRERFTPANDVRPPDDGTSRASRTPIERTPIEISANVADVVDKAERVLGAATDIFQQDGRLIRTVRVAREDAEREGIAPGTPTTRIVTEASLRDVLSRVAVFQRLGKFDPMTGEQKVTEVAPPKDVLESLLARGEYPHVRVLRGITECPILRADGSVLQSPGYDAATGFFYAAPATPFPPVLGCPDVEDARRALSALSEPFCDFPFVSESARSVALAGLLALVGRAAVGPRANLPCIVLDAPEKGTGKSLVADVIATIGMGRPFRKTDFPHTDEELSKLMFAFAAKGSQAVCFDNLKRPLGGSALEAILTCSGGIEQRKLGVTEAPEYPWTGAIFVTGNNVAFIDDMLRRSLVCRLDAKTESPTARGGWRYPNLLQWCEDNRPALVVAALTLLRAYILAGKPGAPRKASFEQFAALVAGAIVWAGGANPLESVPPESASVERDERRELYDAWPEGKAFTAKQLAAIAGGSVELSGPSPFTTAEERRNFGEALRMTLPPDRRSAPSALYLGNALRRHLDCVVGDRVLHQEAGGPKKAPVSWVVVKAA